MRFDQGIIESIFRPVHTGINQQTEPSALHQHLHFTNPALFTNPCTSRLHVASASNCNVTAQPLAVTHVTRGTTTVLQHRAAAHTRIAAGVRGSAAAAQHTTQLYSIQCTQTTPPACNAAADAPPHSETLCVLTRMGSAEAGVGRDEYKYTATLCLRVGVHMALSAPDLIRTPKLSKAQTP